MNTLSNRKKVRPLTLYLRSRPRRLCQRTFEAQPFQISYIIEYHKCNNQGFFIMPFVNGMVFFKSCMFFTLFKDNTMYIVSLSETKNIPFHSISFHNQFCADFICIADNSVLRNISFLCEVNSLIFYISRLYVLCVVNANFSFHKRV